MRLPFIFAVAAVAMNSSSSLVAASSKDEALVSFNRMTDLVWSSIELGSDLVKFGSTKLQESLTGEPKKVYDRFVDHSVEYKGMVAEWYRNSALVAGVTDNLVKPIAGVLKGRYDAFNKLNHMYLDPIVEDFEDRYPGSAGLLGSELIDRALVVIYLYMCVRFALQLMCGGCCRKNARQGK